MYNLEIWKKSPINYNMHPIIIFKCYAVFSKREQLKLTIERINRMKLIFVIVVWVLLTGTVSTSISVCHSDYMLSWLPAKSRASRASWSGGSGICCATQMAFLQLEQLVKACSALAGSPHRHSNKPACSACCCSTRCSAYAELRSWRQKDKIYSGLTNSQRV